jgi:hypothetical protein
VPADLARLARHTLGVGAVGRGSEPGRAAVVDRDEPAVEPPERVAIALDLDGSPAVRCRESVHEPAPTLAGRAGVTDLPKMAQAHAC